MPETSLNLCGEFRSIPDGKEGERQHWLDLPACLWDSFLWGNNIFNARQMVMTNRTRQCWRHAMLHNVSRNQDYGSLLLNRLEHHRPPGVSHGNESPCCCSADSTGHPGKWNGRCHQHGACLLDGKYQLSQDTTDSFVRLLWSGSPTAASWLSVTGLSVQQRKAVLCLDDVRLVGLRGLLVRDAPERLSTVGFSSLWL